MDTQALAKAVTMAAPFVLKSDIIPTMACICFDRESVFATNDQQAIVIKLATDLHAGIPGKMLQGVIKTIDTPEVTLEQTSPHNVVLRHGDSEARLSAVPAEDFVFAFPDTTEMPYIELPGEFGQALEMAMYSLDKTNPSLVLRHVYFNAEATSVTLCSSDMASISVYLLTLPRPIALGTHVVTLLPQLFCEQCLRTLKLLDEIPPLRLYIDKTAAVLKVGDDISIMTKLRDLPIPDYKEQIENVVDSKIAVTQIPEELFSAIDRCTKMLSLSGSANTGIEISTEKADKLLVSVVTEKGNSANESIDIAHQFPPMRFMSQGKLWKRVTNKADLFAINKIACTLFINDVQEFMYLIATR